MLVWPLSYWYVPVSIFTLNEPSYIWESVFTGWKKKKKTCRYTCRYTEKKKGTEIQRTWRWDWDSTWQHPAARSDLTPLLHLYQNIQTASAQWRRNSTTWTMRLNNQEWKETNSSTSTPTHSLPPPYWSKNKMFLAGCKKGLQTVDVLSAHVEIILLKEIVPDIDDSRDASPSCH